MRTLLALAAALGLFAVFLTQPVVARADSCQFILGFKVIHDALPAQVGDCTGDENRDTFGNSRQATTGPTGAGGLLVWRKGDNWTAYTDGYHTWVNGYFGLEERLNTERFAYELRGDLNIINGNYHPWPIAATAHQIDTCYAFWVNLPPSIANGQSNDIQIEIRKGFCRNVLRSPAGVAAHPTWWQGR